MARVLLPVVDKGECCPTCHRLLSDHYFSGQLGYTSNGIVGNAVDPMEVQGPMIEPDEDLS